MQRTTRMIAAGALSVPMALGVSGVALAGQEHDANADTQAQAQVQVQQQQDVDQDRNGNGDGLLGANLVKFRNDDNQAQARSSAQADNDVLLDFSDVGRDDRSGNEQDGNDGLFGANLIQFQDDADGGAQARSSAQADNDALLDFSDVTD